MLDTADQTRGRILGEAEGLFARYGYAKTTMADIAAACGMSPANLYRFFESKNAIVGGIAERYLGDMEADALQIARRPAPATERLRAYVLEIFDKTVERYMANDKIHEICLMVIAEQWPLCMAHVDRMREILSLILADGKESGEFYVDDPAAMAATVKNALIKFHHPGVVTDCIEEPLRQQAEDMTELLIRALGRPV